MCGSILVEPGGTARCTSAFPIWIGSHEARRKLVHALDGHLDAILGHERDGPSGPGRRTRSWSARPGRRSAGRRVRRTHGSSAGDAVAENSWTRTPRPCSAGPPGRGRSRWRAVPRGGGRARRRRPASERLVDVLQLWGPREVGSEAAQPLMLANLVDHDRGEGGVELTVVPGRLLEIVDQRAQASRPSRSRWLRAREAAPAEERYNMARKPRTSRMPSSQPIPAITTLMPNERRRAKPSSEGVQDLLASRVSYSS